MSQPGDPNRPISIARILLLVVPVAVLGLAAFVWSRQLETQAIQQSAPDTISRMFTAEELIDDAPLAYADADKDEVADPPQDQAALISPEEIVFSFVAGDTESVTEDQCKELFAALQEKTGRPVKYVHFENVTDQLDALKKGELHVAGLNTGVVPTAVRRDGFVPLCTFGREDGSYGYTMEFIVPANSPIKDIKDIQGHKVMFTRLDSNSGFKAPLVLLLDEYKMLPDRDYQWGFSQGHEASIKGIAEKDFEVAPVASDILARMKEKGEVDPEAVRSIYTSERFPPATIGVVYNLDPELRKNIEDALMAFSIKGSGLDGEFGADVTKFVPVNYKDDWDSTRRIDRVVAQARQPSRP
jgi:phosphonate transport system substrate-binding protein